MSTETTPFATVEEALEDIAAGKMIVVVDDEDRENEGDLVMAAEFVTADDINFMATHARGWICLALTGDRCDELDLELMSLRNETAHATPFTVTIEAREGVTTGVSAADRAHTIRVAVDPEKGPQDIVKGGHVNPLKARPGGVLERTGHTEASIDLARLAGCVPAGVICEVMNEDGSMARVGDLRAYCFKHGLRMITIADLIAYRRRNDKLIERVVATTLPTTFGDFEVVGYRSLMDDKHHVALVKGDVAGAEDVLVRMHSECLTGDVFHSLRCDCGEQLESALSMIEREGRGVLVYLAQEGRGIGLLNKLRAYKLQEQGLDTVDANLELGLPADLREYGIGAQILVDLGLSSIRILTNNPKKIHGLQGYGLSVSEQVPIEHVPNPHNEGYLRAKAERMGHMLHHQGLNLDEEMRHLRERPGRAAAGGRASGELRDRRRALLRAPRRPPHRRRSDRLRRGRRRRGRRLRRARRLRAAARRALRGADRALRRRLLPGRRHPRRDRPLRLGLRRVRARDPGRPALHRRAVRVRRADRRHDGAGARALGRRQARLRPPRRRGRARAGAPARAAGRRLAPPPRVERRSCRAMTW